MAGGAGTGGIGDDDIAWERGNHAIKMGIGIGVGVLAFVIILVHILHHCGTKRAERQTMMKLLLLLRGGHCLGMSCHHHMPLLNARNLVLAVQRQTLTGYNHHHQKQWQLQLMTTYHHQITATL